MNKPFLFSGRIHNCYDSHVHWLATGSLACWLELKSLTHPEQVASLKIQKQNYYGEWLLGYGWDQHKFENQEYPHRRTLDKVFFDTPVMFKRTDAHAAWVNTAALKRAGIFEKDVKSPYGGKIELDHQGWPTGILIDHAVSILNKLIPQADANQQQQELLAGQEVFHRAGFTHIRDFTNDQAQWQAALNLESQNKLKLVVEQFFRADDADAFTESVRLAVEAKKHNSKLLKAKGVKVFFDGALGSEGAWISRPYSSGSGQGLQLLTHEQLDYMIRTCHENKIELAVHTIGDEAAHQIIRSAHNLKQKNQCCVLHIEHAELLRPESIALLRELPVTCHIQPSHWLSDKVWLKDKIGDLVNCAFRWRDLEDNDIKFFFGSDSPIEPTSLQKTLDALIDAQKFDIPFVRNDWTTYHQYENNIGNTYTEFENGRPVRIQFFGEEIKIPHAE